MTGGTEINFWGGAREVYLYEFEGGMGAREVYLSVDETKKVKTKKKVFTTRNSTHSGCRLKILAIFHELLSEDQKKKSSSSQKFYEIRCESTKITKKQFLLASSTTVNTNLGVLGLDLHSSSPEHVNFFGAQFSLGGHNFRLGGCTSSHWGARPRNDP